jgi:hypothetical protein
VATAAAAAAVIAAANAFRALDAPGFFFSLVKVRISTNTLSRHGGFNRVAMQLETVLHG